MDVKVIATSDFVHGRFNMIKGQRGALPAQTAKELANAGLVVTGEAAEKSAAPTVKLPKPRANKMAAAGDNKSVEVDGAQPGGAPASVPASAAEAAAGLPDASADVCTDQSTGADAG